MPPFLRPFLAVAQTTLTDPTTGECYPFNGLYTTVNLPKGSFLGFYNGDFEDGEFRGRDSYVFSLSNVHIRPQKVKGRIDSTRYPLAMCNEPPVSTVANVHVYEFSKAKGVIPQLKPTADVSALAFYTGRDVKGGAELFVHYGSHYDRSHYALYDQTENPLALVGRPCKTLKAERELPMDMMRHFGLMYVDRECYVELV
jgi:hypothetical protein